MGIQNILFALDRLPGIGLMLFIEQFAIFVCTQGNLVLVVSNAFVHLPGTSCVPRGVLHPEHSLEIEVGDELMLTAFEDLVLVPFAFFGLGKFADRIPSGTRLQPVLVAGELR